MVSIMRMLFIIPVALASPPFWEKAKTARYMANTLDWGVLSTTSTRSEASIVGDAFGNPYSFSDATTGVPYFFASMLDASMIDLFGANTAKPRASLALSEAEITNPSIIMRQKCSIGTYLGDPGDPPCARLVLSGTMVQLKANSTEDKFARAALYKRHPSFAQYPAGHDFFTAKMEIDGIWLIDMFGGASNVPLSEYFNASFDALGSFNPNARAAEAKALTTVVQPPDYNNKNATARWMASKLVWGVLSTISTRSFASTVGDAFGNPNSFADVNGAPYFYVSDMDSSMIDIFTAKTANPRVSLALSEATLLGTVDSRPDCKVGAGFGDPENPPCARLTLSGKMVRVAANSTEETTAKKALFAKHPSFLKYPKDHEWYIAKLEIDGVWLIDFYGGASIIKPSDYFAANPTSVGSIVV